MDKPMQIYADIPAIMADIGAIGKDRKNAQQGFRFRGIDEVMNTLKPILTKHQVFTVPEVLEQARETKTTKTGTELHYSLLKMRFRFYAVDGSYVEATTMGEGMDSGDKASNKAMSIAYKYALFQTFCIPTEEMIDPDAETPPLTVPQNPVQVSKPEHVPPQPMSTKDIIRGYMRRRGMTDAEFDSKRKALMNGGIVQDIPSSRLTVIEAQALVDAIEANFPPESAG